MVRTKERMQISLSSDILSWLDKNTNNKSSFIEGALRDRIKKVMNPQDALRQEIKYHDNKAREHQEIKFELEKQLQIKNGKLKIVSSEALDELNKKADLLDSMESYQSEQQEKNKEILDYAPLTSTVRKDGTIIGQNISKEQLRKKALKIIEEP